MLVRSIFVAVFSLLCVRASAQSVISAHAGLVHFFEGGVAIDGQPIVPVNGRFREIPEGSVLNTNDGRAEVLLGPEVYLWVGPNSAIRVRRNTLDDALVELVAGSAIVESRQLPPENTVKVIFNASEIRLSAHSIHRFDAGDSLAQWVTERRRLIAAAATTSTKKRSHPQRRPYPAVMIPIPGRSF